MSICSQMLSDDKVSFFTAYRNVASILSLITSSMVLASYAILPNLRKNQNLRYIAYLTLANVLLSITSLIGIKISMASMSQNTIYVIYFLVDYTGTTLIAWAIIFVINVYNIISNQSANWVTNERLILVIGYGLTIPVASLLFWSQIGGFSQDEANAFFYAFDGLALCSLLFMYLKLMMKSKKLMEHESAKRVCYQTIGYSIVLTINLMCNIIAQIIVQVNGCMNESYFWLHGVWYLQGFIDSIVYGMNPIFRQELRTFLTRKDSNKTRILDVSAGINA